MLRQRSDHDSFSKQLRQATRDVHKISDALVNAKLAFALSDDSVWAEGLLIFYEIFKYLEEHASPEILPIEFHRKEAFEKDLKYYLGTDWKQSYKPREAVQKYLNHLKEINNENPILLLAYIYHLYMGLLSGGQILQKKRSLAKKLNILQKLSNDDDGDDNDYRDNDNRVNLNHKGFEITYFDDVTITELKMQMRNLVDNLGETFNDETKNALLHESRKVFELNNEIIRTVKGVDRVNMRKLIFFFVILTILYSIYRLYLLNYLVHRN